MELIELETREKDLHDTLVMQIDSVTSYKPVIFPNLVRFNEDIFNEVDNV